MFDKKIVPTVLRWLGIAVVASVLMAMLLKFSYMGPEAKILSFYINVTKTIFIATAVLGTVIEVFVRGMKKIKGS
jgi:multisubunit Na+/H+ antiporter MnhB subunit